MPGEEGYPAYLGSRIANFYERAGSVVCLGSDDRSGAITVIGAVSPPGGDFSEPVVQATLRVVKVFWGLDDKLAFSRHFPAVNWLTSYSLYQDMVDECSDCKFDAQWSINRKRAMDILQRESELEELVRLVGIDALPHEDRLLMQAAKMIREDFLHQNAFDERDACTSMDKQFSLLKLILHYFDKINSSYSDGATLESLTSNDVLGDIARAKLIPEEDLDQFEMLELKITNTICAITW